MIKTGHNELPIIANEDIILRPISLEDTEKIVKWRNNPLVVSNFIFRETMTREMHEKWFRERVITGNVIQYVIIHKKTQTAMGSIYFRDINYIHKHAEFGIFIGEDEMRGKGFGKLASKMFITFGTETVGLHKIYLRVIADNYTAINMYTSLGFQLEGIAKDLVYIDDQYKSVLFMAINGEK